MLRGETVAGFDIDLGAHTCLKLLFPKFDTLPIEVLQLIEGANEEPNFLVAQVAQRLDLAIRFILLQALKNIVDIEKVFILRDQIQM